MSAHKQIVAETWNELQALENETDALLKSVRDFQKAGGDNKKKGGGFRTGGAKELIQKDAKASKKSGKKSGNKDKMMDSGGKGSKSFGKSSKSKQVSMAMVDEHSKTQTMNAKMMMSKSLDTGMLDKTRQLYEESIGRVTVEVLDDASPDVTPRGEDEEKLFQERMKLVEENKAQGERVRSTEAIYRESDFKKEKKRILESSDIFISAPGVSAEDVKKERERLMKLEAAARRKRKQYLAEVGQRSEYLAQDRSAIYIQKMYRGHIGRRKFRLSYRLKEIEKKRGEMEMIWIEVRDRESGDVWYYNKETGQSQWDKPDDMFSVLPTQDSIRHMPIDESKRGDNQYEHNKKDFVLQGHLPSDEAIRKAKRGELSVEEAKRKAAEEHAKEVEVKQEVLKDIGVDKFLPQDNLSAPDGSFKPQLRKTVMDALLETRFDSVSTVLADQRWTKSNKDPFKKTQPVQKMPPADPNRPRMVSVMKYGQPDTSAIIHVDAEGKDIMAENLTVTDVKHPGFNSVESRDGSSIAEVDDDSPFDPNVTCFACWSAGAKRKCSLHDTGDMLKPSQTMLLCRNWDLAVLRRRYRSEEIQEIFMKKGSSLRYDVKRKAFLTVVEQRHQIYRSLKNLTELFNFRMLLWMKIKRWLNSLADEVRSKPTTKQSQARVKMMRDRRTMIHAYQLTQLLNEVKELLPIPPITGTSWPERIGQIQYLFKRADAASGKEVELILAYPTPPNQTLYQSREYHLAVPKSIPMPKPAYLKEDVKDVLPASRMVPDTNHGAWLERMSRAISASSVFDALDQVETITPVGGLELLRRTKQPPPCTIKFATRGKKPTPNNLAVGGLPSELLVYSMISTYIPPQYGNFMTMDKSTVSPGVTPEIMIQFQSILLPPIVQIYIMRQLEHPLNYRRSPTIIANSAIEPMNKHYYGKNRPDQTGEQEPNGFRTSCWAKYVVVSEVVDPNVFTPGPEVVSLNAPGSNISVTTHADHTYPFCEPSTRDNSTLDFFHLLLEGAVSGSKQQVFTALTVQEPGLFLRETNAELPLGHLVVSVYRSWAFTQKETIEEFKTDDGVSYWYHRRTGQTFWERPLYDEESTKVLDGGTELDMMHPEEPLLVHKGQEGAERRYTQGEFRQLMLVHHENDDEAGKRRKHAHMAGRVARDRGALPNVPAGMTEDEYILATTSQAAVGDDGSINASVDNLGLQFPNKGNESMQAHHQSLGSPGSFAKSIDNAPGSVGPRTGVNGGLFQGSEDFGPVAKPGAIAGGGVPNVDVTQPNPIERGGAKRLGSALDEGSMEGGSVAEGSTFGQYKKPTDEKVVDNQIKIPGIMPGMAVAGVNTDMMSNLTQGLAAMMTQFSTLGSQQNPQDMLSLGMGMGMALLQSGAANAMTDVKEYEDPGKPKTSNRKFNNKYSVSATEENGQPVESGLFPELSEEEFKEIEANRKPKQVSNISTNVRVGPADGHQPIGEPEPNEVFSVDKILDKAEEERQKAERKKLLTDPLSALEHARGLRVMNEATETPDVAPEKMLTIEKPKNAEEEMKAKVPVMIYPELSTMVSPNGPPAEVTTHDPAGLGTSFVRQAEGSEQERVKGSDVLRKTVVPLPVGFYQAIVAKHIAKQEVDYLPMVPNLPQARTVGRVKPRSAAIDWLAISFDPWSAGKNPLSSEFVHSLAAKAEKIFGQDAAAALDQLDKLRETTSDAYMTTDDKEGQAEMRKEVTKEQLLAADFEKVCSLCRHSKFADVESLVNQPDWNVPVDYQNDMGNTLLHIVSQNGNKRLVKLCLRRGCNINLQNLTGQTALHFAYGYGYDELGDYLVSKGCDDSIKNKDGLTCYEGLGEAELNLL